MELNVNMLPALASPVTTLVFVAEMENVMLQTHARVTMVTLDWSAVTQPVSESTQQMLMYVTVTDLAQRLIFVTALIHSNGLIWTVPCQCAMESLPLQQTYKVECLFVMDMVNASLQIHAVVLLRTRLDPSVT
jgi:hypothetical protein